MDVSMPSGPSSAPPTMHKGLKCVADCYPTLGPDPFHTPDLLAFAIIAGIALGSLRLAVRRMRLTNWAGQRPVH